MAPGPQFPWRSWLVFLEHTIPRPGKLLQFWALLSLLESRICDFYCGCIGQLFPLVSRGMTKHWPQWTESCFDVFQTGSGEKVPGEAWVLLTLAQHGRICSYTIKYEMDSFLRWTLFSPQMICLQKSNHWRTGELKPKQINKRQKKNSSCFQSYTSWGFLDLKSDKMS